MCRIYKSFIIFLLCLGIGVIVVTFQSRNTNSQAIEKLTKKFTEAVIKKDSTMLNKIFADKVEIEVPLSQGIFNKEDLINRICAYEFTIENIEVSDVYIKSNSESAEIYFKQIEWIKSSPQNTSLLTKRVSMCNFKFEKQNDNWHLSSVKINRN